MRPPAPFVVGVPRSGTTLLRLMLDAHPDLAIPGETHFIPAVIRRWGEMDAAGVPDAERRREVLALITGHHRWADLGLEVEQLERQLARPSRLGLDDAARAVHLANAEAHGKARWGDKTPSYLTKLPRIQRAIGEASFVHLIRDGRDVALSWSEVSWGVDEVAEAARRWRDDIGLARRRARRLRSGSYLELRYEDLVGDPEPTLRRVAAAIELPWEDAMLSYHLGASERMAPTMHDHTVRERTISADERRRQHALVSEPPRSDRIGRWRREMPPADLRAFESVAGELLVELGYELTEG